MNYSPTAATFARPAPSRACGPVLLVLASRQSVAKAVQPLCDMLALQLRPVATMAEFRAAIAKDRPVAAMVHVPLYDTAITGALDALVSYNVDLPVLLMGDSAQPGAPVGAVAERLHPMQAMQRLAGPPTPKDLMNFIFHAERNHHASG